MAKNGNLNGAKKAKKDEFYTQYADIEKEMNAYSGKAATNGNYHTSTGSLNPASISEPSKGGAAGSNYRLSDVYSEFPYNSSIGTSGTANPSGEGLVKVTRIIKRRTVSKDIIDIGQVSLVNRKAKPSSEINVGDLITLSLGNRIITIEDGKIKSEV